MAMGAVTSVDLNDPGGKNSRPRIATGAQLKVRCPDSMFSPSLGGRHRVAPLFLRQANKI